MKVENPQYKMSGNDDEQLTLGVGPTVRVASLVQSPIVNLLQVFRANDILAKFCETPETAL